MKNPYISKSQHHAMYVIRFYCQLDDQFLIYKDTFGVKHDTVLPQQTAAADHSNLILLLN
jgi:hypothetical protein